MSESGRQRRLRRAGNEISRSFVSQENTTNPDFWRSFWPILRHLSSFEAVLRERVFYFNLKKSRGNAWALIMQVDMVWQVVRQLGGKTGSDQNLKAAYLSNNYTDVPSDSPFGFHTDAEAFDLLNYVYVLHSVLRHPTQENSIALDWLFYDPWPDVEAEKLLNAAVVMSSAFSQLKFMFDPGTGFEGDCLAKQRLANQAA